MSCTWSLFIGLKSLKTMHEVKKRITMEFMTLETPYMQFIVWLQSKWHLEEKESLEKYKDEDFLDIHYIILHFITLLLECP